MHDGADKSAVDAGHAAPPPSPRATLAGASDPEAASALDDRISSGEFTDAGSTKERISRPVRKFFALDPVGPGKEEGEEMGTKRANPTLDRGRLTLLFLRDCGAGDTRAAGMRLLSAGTARSYSSTALATSGISLALLTPRNPPPSSDPH